MPRVIPEVSDFDSAEDYADAGDATTLATAEAYTDAQVATKLSSSSLIVTDTPQALTTAEAASAVNFTTVSYYKQITLTAALTLPTPTAPPSGSKVRLEFIQNATGTWLVTFPTVFLNTSPVNQQASSKTLYEFTYDGTNYVRDRDIPTFGLNYTFYNNLVTR